MPRFEKTHIWKWRSAAQVDAIVRAELGEGWLDAPRFTLPMVPAQRLAFSLSHVDTVIFAILAALAAFDFNGRLKADESYWLARWDQRASAISARLRLPKAPRRSWTQKARAASEASCSASANGSGGIAAMALAPHTNTLVTEQPGERQGLRAKSSQVKRKR